MKVTFLTVMPSPYVQDLFAALDADPRMELRVLYMEQQAPDTHWGEQRLPAYAELLPGRWFGFSGARIHWNPAIRQKLQRHAADIVVVVGYVGLTNQIAMRWLNRRRRPWAFWGEVPGLHDRGWLGRWLRHIAQGPLRGAAGVAAVGSHAKRAYEELLNDENDERIYANIPYHCRLDPFRKAATDRVQSDTLRFLYCGQLIHRKGVDLLCEAFARLVNGGVDARLSLVGTGPLDEDLRRSLSSDVAQRVNFAGFQEVDRLPDYFANADVFVLPSRHDGWGVVINQALAAGLPVIATTSVGAANDLVQEHINGLRIEADSTEALYQAMRHFVDHPDDVGRWGSHSLQISQSIDLCQAVEDWYRFLSDVLASPAERSQSRGQLPQPSSQLTESLR